MSDRGENIYPVLLAGGTGTRLWPVSRELYPKQFAKIIGKDSLVQSTIKRLSPLFDMGKIRIVCGREHFYEIARHVTEIGIQAKGKIICEPSSRNTAPAIILAVLNILKIDSDAVLCVFPADHVIENIESFHERVKTAIRLADMGYIITFGIKPHYPETGYGYIEAAGEVFPIEGEDRFDRALTIKRFVEKPDRETAKRYVEDGNFFWNSGMFAFKASVMLKEFETYQPETLEKMKDMVLIKSSVTEKGYNQLPNISIDYAIMEKTDRAVVLPSDFGWSDIGSWRSLYDFLPKDENRNVIDGDIITRDTKNCFIMGQKRLIVTNRISNMVVVETCDSLLVSDIDSSSDIKSIVAQLKKDGRKEYREHKTVYHSWGTLTVLEQENDLGIYRLVIHPNSALQVKVEATILKRLIIIKGLAKITSGRQSRLFKKGESIVIVDRNTEEFFEKGFAELENPGNEPLCIIQIETGS